MIHLKEAIRPIGNRVWVKDRVNKPEPNSRGRSRRRLAARLGLWLGATGIAVVALIFGFGGQILNGVVKGKVEQAFAKAHPGSALRLGHLRYLVGDNILSAQSVALNSTHLTFKTGQISLTGVRWVRLLWGRRDWARVLAFASLDATNLDAAFPQALYGLRCARLRASVPDSKLLLLGTDLRPLVEDEAFFAAHTFRTTRFRLAVPEFEVLGLAYGELLQGKSYRAGSIRLSGASFDALVSRDKPVRSSPKSPLMLQEALAAIRQPLRVDNISITKADLRYGERVRAGAAPGVLTFGNADFYVSDLANRRDDSKDIRIEAQTQFMNAAALRVQMTIPAGSPEVSFHYAGSLSAMDLTRLNPFLETVEHFRIVSGSVQDVLFAIDVAAGEARGQVRARYQDLKIAVLDKQTGSETGIDNRVVSFLMNALKIRNASPAAESGSMKDGKVVYTRKPQDNFLQFMWFALRSGILDVISL